MGSSQQPVHPRLAPCNRRGLASPLSSTPEGEEGDEGDEGDEGHVSELAKSDWCMGLAPGCGRVRSVVERKPEDAADSLSLRTNSRCMPTDLSKNK